MLLWRPTNSYQCLTPLKRMLVCQILPNTKFIWRILLQANTRGLIKAGDRVVVSQCPRVNERFPVMAEAGVVKILTIDSDGVQPANPVVVTEQGVQRCTSTHVFGSRDAIHDCSDLV